MEANLEQDIEQQLQDELERFKKAIEYIEEAKANFAQSQELLVSTQTKYTEVSKSQDALKLEFRTNISETERNIKEIQATIENNFLNQISLIQEDIKNLKDHKEQNKEFETIKAEILKQEKLFDDTQTKYFENSKSQEKLKQIFQASVSENEDKIKSLQIVIDDKYSGQFSTIQEDIKKLNNHKEQNKAFETIKTELLKQEKLYDDTQTRYSELSKSQETLKQIIQTYISENEGKLKSHQLEIENNFSRQFSDIQIDIDKLNNLKEQNKKIEGINAEILKQQKLINSNISKNNSELNDKIVQLTNKIKSNRLFNYVLFLLLILSLISFRLIPRHFWSILFS